MEDESKPIAVSSTWALVTINLLVFVMMVVKGVSPSEPTALDLLRFGANRGVTVVGENEWWRPFMSMFIHVGFLHLAINMFSLTQIGPAVERLFGQVLFVVLFVFSGLLGSLLSNAVHPLTVSAGASGALFGLLGCLLAFTFFSGNQVNPVALKQMRQGLLLSLAINAAYGLLNPRLDNACHLGGFLGGFGFGTWMTVTRPKTNPYWKLGTALGLVGVMLAAVGGTIWKVSREPLVQWQKQLDAIDKAQQTQDSATMLKGLNTAFDTIPDSVKNDSDLMNGFRSMRAGALMAENQYPEAEAELQRVLSDADDAVTRNNLAWSQLQQDKLGAALDNVNRSIQITPSALAYGTRCFVYAAMDDTELALADCRLATRGDANPFDLGMLAFLEKRYESALKEWTRAARTPQATRELTPWIEKATRAKATAPK